MLGSRARAGGELAGGEPVVPAASPPDGAGRGARRPRPAASARGTPQANSGDMSDTSDSDVVDECGSSDGGVDTGVSRAEQVCAKVNGVDGQSTALAGSS